MRLLIGYLICRKARQIRGLALNQIARQQFPCRLRCNCCNACAILKMVGPRRFWNGFKSMLENKDTLLKVWSMMNNTDKVPQTSRCATLSPACVWFRISIGRRGLTVSVLLTRHCARFLSTRKWISRAATFTAQQSKSWRVDHPTAKLILFSALSHMFRAPMRPPPNLAIG